MIEILVLGALVLFFWRGKAQPQPASGLQPVSGFVPEPPRLTTITATLTDPGGKAADPEGPAGIVPVETRIGGDEYTIMPITPRTGQPLPSGDLQLLEAEMEDTVPTDGLPDPHETWAKLKSIFEAAPLAEKNPGGVGYRGKHGMVIHEWAGVPGRVVYFSKAQEREVTDLINLWDLQKQRQMQAWEAKGYEPWELLIQDDGRVVLRDSGRPTA
jgi:hypothetical protein